jgi:NitT/TauT family transport system substrate-binding protein
MRNRGTLLACLVAFGLSGFAIPVIAAEKTKINFVLDWIVGGRHAGWFAALKNGYFADEGLDVTISRGFGSGRGIKRMVAGKADISFNDIATAILARAKTGAAIKAVSVSYAKHPSAIFTHKRFKILTPKDLEGATLADSAGSTNRLLFPAFAKLAGFDDSKVKWALVAPNAKMSIFMAGKVQGTLFYNMQLPVMQKKAAGTGGVNMIEFGDYMKLYSNGILVTDSFLKSNPDVVRRFVKAALKGWEFSFKDPDKAVKMLMTDHPLLNPAIAKSEALIVKNLMLSPEARKHGLGYMDEGKMRQTRDTMLKLFNVKATVALKDIYTNAFLPSSK